MSSLATGIPLILALFSELESLADTGRGVLGVFVLLSAKKQTSECDCSPGRWDEDRL